MDNTQARLFVSNYMFIFGAIVGVIVWSKNYLPITSNVFNVGILPHPFGNAHFKTA